MQHAAASAYARTAQVALTPRELEASLLLKAAHRLQSIADDWVRAEAELTPALTYNRRIWTILATSATAVESPLPEAIKRNVAQLAEFIFNRTLAVLADPAPGKLASLIGINRDIAAGLRARQDSPAAQPMAAIVSQSATSASRSAPSMSTLTL